METETISLEFLIKQSAFLNRHIGCWVGAFQLNVQTRAKTEFYKTLATAADIWVKEDLSHLNEFAYRGSDKSSAPNTMPFRLNPNPPL